MLSKNFIKKFITSFTVMAVMCLYTNFTFGQDTNLGELTTTGQVTVNGQAAGASSTITSNSTIRTGANSTAIVNFGNNSKIELFANSQINLKFTSNSIAGVLTSGKVRVLTAAGIGATIVTKSATTVADTGRANSFIVSLGCAEDTDCQDTTVQTISGLVVMISNADQTRKQVPAGTQAVSGDTCNQVCRVPGVLPIALNDRINPALLALLLGGIGAIAVGAILIGGDDPPPPPPLEPPVISPIA
jgi:hypothetical protein